MFPVQFKINEKNNLYQKSKSSKLVYVDLKANEET